VLATAIPAHDNDLIALAVDTVGGELRDLTERIPDRRNTIVSGGDKERNLARMALKEVVLILRSISLDAADGNYSGAARDYANYNRFMNGRCSTRPFTTLSMPRCGSCLSRKKPPSNRVSS
jgi:hypothetical protein